MTKAGVAILSPIIALFLGPLCSNTSSLEQRLNKRDRHRLKVKSNYILALQRTFLCLMPF